MTQSAKVPGTLRPRDTLRLQGCAPGCGRVVLGEARGLPCPCWAFPNGSMGEAGGGGQREVFSGGRRDPLENWGLLLA